MPALYISRNLPRHPSQQQRDFLPENCRQKHYYLKSSVQKNQILTMGVSISCQISYKLSISFIDAMIADEQRSVRRL